MKMQPLSSENMIETYFLPFEIDTEDRNYLYIPYGLIRKDIITMEYIVIGCNHDLNNRGTNIYKICAPLGKEVPIPNDVDSVELESIDHPVMKNLDAHLQNILNNQPRPFDETDLSDFYRDTISSFVLMGHIKKKEEQGERLEFRVAATRDLTEGYAKHKGNDFTLHFTTPCQKWTQFIDSKQVARVEVTKRKELYYNERNSNSYLNTYYKSVTNDKQIKALSDKINHHMIDYLSRFGFVANKQMDCITNVRRMQAFNVNPSVFVNTANQNTGRFTGIGFVDSVFLNTVDDGVSLIEEYTKRYNANKSMIKKALKMRLSHALFEKLQYFEDVRVMDKFFDIKCSVFDQFSFLSSKRNSGKVEKYAPTYRQVYADTLLSRYPFDDFFGGTHPQNIINLDEVFDAMENFINYYLLPFMGYHHDPDHGRNIPRYVDKKMLGNVLLDLFPTYQSLVPLIRFFHEHPGFTTFTGMETGLRWSYNFGLFSFIDTRAEIKPLCSVEDFIKEGREMKHCVASHCRGAFGGSYVVFSIKGPMRSTLEVDMNGRIIQHYGSHNSDASRNNEIARKIADFVVKQKPKISWVHTAETAPVQPIGKVPPRAQNVEIAVLWATQYSLERLEKAVDNATDPNRIFRVKPEQKTVITTSPSTFRF